MKKIDLGDSIFSLVATYPEIKDIMFDLGFKDIVKPSMLHTVGKYMSIKQGCKLKRLNLDNIIIVFENNGFEVTL